MIPDYSPRRALGWYRFVLWVLPSALPLAVFAVGWIPFMPFPRLLVWPLLLVAVGYAGYFDALLSCQQRRIPRDDPKARIVGRVILFAILQLVIVPLVWVTVLWGICAATGGL
jgi:hypothetical protein